MKKLLIIIGVVLVAIIIVVVLRRGSGVTDQNFVIGEASVSEVVLNLQESFPVGVVAGVSGTLPDGCTELGDVIQNKDLQGNFIVTLQTRRPLDTVCTQAISDFNTEITIEGTTGLVAGEYAVIVNGVRETFTFEVDNFMSTVDPLK